MPAILGGVITALVGSIGAYLLAAKRMSGKIKTSDASELWAESRSMRDDYRSQLKEQAERARALEARLDAMAMENRSLKNEVKELKAISEHCEETIRRMAATIEALGGRTE